MKLEKLTDEVLKEMNRRDDEIGYKWNCDRNIMEDIIEEATEIAFNLMNSQTHGGGKQ